MKAWILIAIVALAAGMLARLPKEQVKPPVFVYLGAYGLFLLVMAWPWSRGITAEHAEAYYGLLAISVVAAMAAAWEFSSVHPGPFRALTVVGSASFAAASAVVIGYHYLAVLRLKDARFELIWNDLAQLLIFGVMLGCGVMTLLSLAAPGDAAVVTQRLAFGLLWTLTAAFGLAAAPGMVRAEALFRWLNGWVHFAIAAATLGGMTVRMAGWQGEAMGIPVWLALAGHLRATTGGWGSVVVRLVRR